MNCVVRGTPPKTPTRTKRVVQVSPRTASRRSLFREESDLSDISPLSPSSDEKTPLRRSPRKIDTTPLKNMGCISTLSLDSPEIKVVANSQATRVKGVNLLKNQDPREIPPKLFYGSHSEPKITKNYDRESVSKAKTKLFLDDLPKDRKRARTSSGQKVQPVPKRMRRITDKPRVVKVPIPKLGQPIKRLKKKISPKQKSDSKKRKTSVPDDHDNSGWDINEVLEPRPGVTPTSTETEADVPSVAKPETSGFMTPSNRKPLNRNSYSTPSNRKSSVDFDAKGWEITFTKKSRLCDNSESTTTSNVTPRRFFKTTSSTPKVERRTSVLTPPSSSKKNQNDHLKKQRALLQTDLLFISPKKPINNIAQEMVKDIEEMVQDELEVDTGVEINQLLETLEQSELPPVVNPSLEMLNMALPSPQEEEEEQSTVLEGKENSVSTNTTKLFPIFTEKKPLSCNSTNTVNSKTDSYKKKNRYMGLGIDQYQIDSGQKGLVEFQCTDCGLFYTKGCPEDELVHSKYHSNYNILSYSGWKNERVVGRNGLDKVIRICKGDPKSWWNKVNSILTLVDDELGFPPVSLESAKSPKVYLYIRENKRIVGCLVCEDISYAYKLLSGNDDCSVDQCSEESFPATCGISRIWVHSSARRSHVATSLVNSLRGTYCHGMILKKENIAFTVPTYEGKKFISKYMGYSDYLVYM